jgi:hypothetical protein
MRHPLQFLKLSLAGRARVQMPTHPLGSALPYSPVLIGAQDPPDRPTHLHLISSLAMKPLHSLLKTLHHGEKFEVICYKPAADRKRWMNLAASLRYNRAVRVVNKALVRL